MGSDNGTGISSQTQASQFDGAAVGFTDTGQWKLIVSIGPGGIFAVLQNTVNPGQKPVVVLRREWHPDSDKILENIESAFYDNPRMLDDFATRIVIDTPKTLWIPEELTEDEEFDPQYFTAVYPAAAEDISAEFSGEEVALFTLVPGLAPFLQRTIPGCKISCSLAVMKERFQQEAKGSSVIVNIADDGWIDILAFRNGQFLSASKQPWREISDVAYRILLLCDSYGLDRTETVVKIYTQGEKGEKLREILADLVADTLLQPLPALTAETGAPLAVSLLTL